MTRSSANNGEIKPPKGFCRILMLLENESYPDDSRVALEAQSLRDAGYTTTVICPTGVSRRIHENVDGVLVYRYPKPWHIGGFVGYVWEYSYSLAATFVLSLYVLFRRGFDVVHVHVPPDMLVIIAAFYKLLGKRYVLDQHDLSPELYQAQHNGQGNRIVYGALCWFERMACRWADYLISTNDTQRRMQIERGGASPDRCRVVRNGPGARFLAPAAPLESLRDGRIVVGYVGMIGVQDGVDYLLRALAFLKDELKRTDFRAVVVGAGPALADLRRLAEAIGVGRQVKFTGYLVGHDLLRHIASFDICVTPDPSNHYNDSCTTVKTMEYMAMAKPVVAFDLPENRVTLSESALYATDNDVCELARCIRQLMDQPHERERLGQLGRQRVIDHFSWERQQQSLIQLYSTLLGHSKECAPAVIERRSVAAGPSATRAYRATAEESNGKLLSHSIENSG